MPLEWIILESAEQTHVQTIAPAKPRPASCAAGTLHQSALRGVFAFLRTPRIFF